MQRVGRFGANELGDLVRALQLGRYDINTRAVRGALHYVKEALHLTDEDLLSNLLQVRNAALPRWLESQASVVGKVTRKLQTHMFPMCKFNRPKNAYNNKQQREAPSTNARSSRSNSSTSSRAPTKYARVVASLSMPKEK